MPNTRRDAIYARYSSHAQDEGTSIEVQIENCRRIAGPDALEFIDRAVTGRSMDRPSFNRLLEAAERGEFDRLIVHRFDRFGRSAHAHAIVQDLEDLGITILSACEGNDPLARGVHLVVGQHYSQVLSERVTESLHQRFDQKRWTGGPPPYGYRIEHRDGGQYLAIHPDESEVVRYIFKTYLDETVGFKEIARRLAARGIPTRHGKTWAFTMIRLILMNQTLVGVVRFGKRKMKRNKQTNRRVPIYTDPSKHRTYSDERLRIISDDDFAAAQSKLEIRRKPMGAPRARRSVRPFTGLIYCGVCNSVYCAQRSRGGHHFYLCTCRSRHGRPACPQSVSHREDRLIADVLGVYGSIFDNTEQLIDEITAETSRLLQAQREDAGRIRTQIIDLDKFAGGVTRLLLDPEFSRDAKSELTRQLSETAKKRAELQQVLDGMAERANRSAERVVQEVKAVVATAREAFANASDPEKLHAFIERFVGPSISTPDGRLVMKPENANGTASNGAAFHSYIAAAGLEPATQGL